MSKNKFKLSHLKKHLNNIVLKNLKECNQSNNNNNNEFYIKRKLTNEIKEFYNYYEQYNLSINKFNINNFDLSNISERNKQFLDLIDIVNNLDIQELLHEINYYDKNSYINKNFYCKLYDSDIITNYNNLFNIGVFKLRNFGHLSKYSKYNIELDLHDHPDMMVISKCLYGKLEIQSYNKIDINNLNNNLKNKLIGKEEKYIATLDKKYLEIEDIGILFPNKDNIHDIKCSNDGSNLINEALLLDVFLPHYNDDNNCSQYSCSFYKSSKVDEYNNLILYELDNLNL